jgi:hypothetical protein
MKVAWKPAFFGDLLHDQPVGDGVVGHRSAGA